VFACRSTAAAALLLACGCGQLPELSYEGEHIRIGTDFDAPLCAGNVADLDHAIEYIEAGLDLHGEGKTELYVLADEELLRSHCNYDGRACAQGGAVKRVFIARDRFGAVWHEIAHDRVHRARRKSNRKTSGLFAEGMAEAFGPLSCEPSEPSWPSAQSLLEARSGVDMSLEGYELAGHLVRGLVRVHGSHKLQDFLADVDRGDRPDAVRDRYREFFGSSIDDDLHEYLDWSIEGRDPQELGCRGEPAPTDASGLVYELRATLDCSSPMVRSNFHETAPELAYVEWHVQINGDPALDGRRWVELVGEVPTGTQLLIQRCDCKQKVSAPTNGSPYFSQHLGTGLHRVVWVGPLDGEHQLDVQLALSCRYDRGECPIPTACADDAACPADQLCNTSLGVCGQPCEPLAQDCPPIYACQPSHASGSAVCVPTAGLGLLESCDGTECADGLQCESLDGVPGCEAPNRCCTPLCDIGPDDNCPAELPSCEPLGAGLGVCQP
jgi:hypothetical protein